MSSSPDPTSLPGMVAAAREALAGVAEVLLSARTPAELLAANAECERLRSELAAVQSRLALEIEAGDLARSAGWASPADYLTATAGGHRGHGRRLLRVARALAGAQHATGESLRSGEISPEHAEVIVSAISRLPVETELRTLAEKTLLEHAAHLDATELRIAGEHLLELLDPEGTARREEKKLDRLERAAHLNRFLSLRDDGLGGVRVTGRGTVEDAAVIRTALAALAAPTADPSRTPGTAPPAPTRATTAPAPGTHWSTPANACSTPPCSRRTTAPNLGWW